MLGAESPVLMMATAPTYVYWSFQFGFVCLPDLDELMVLEGGVGPAVAGLPGPGLLVTGPAPAVLAVVLAEATGQNLVLK